VSTWHSGVKVSAAKAHSSLEAAVKNGHYCTEFPVGLKFIRCGGTTGLTTHNTLFRHDHVDLPSAMQQLFMTISTGVLLVLGLVVSAFYARKL
jgi:hypothetical protein